MATATKPGVKKARPLTLDQAKARVERATVRLTKLGGQGVFVPGGFILTAAHCIEWNGTGGMALGDWMIEPILTAGRLRLHAEVYAAEPCSDVAALGEVDNQVFPKQWDKWAAHLERVQPVPLRQTVPPLREPFAVHVLTHKGAWVVGRATRCGLPGKAPGSRLWVQFQKQIKGGTSGGPVIDDAGELVGIVSFSSETGGVCDGLIPFPMLALPRWLSDKILASQTENK